MPWKRSSDILPMPRANRKKAFGRLTVNPRVKRQLRKRRNRQRRQGRA